MKAWVLIKLRLKSFIPFFPVLVKNFQLANRVDRDPVRNFPPHLVGLAPMEACRARNKAAVPRGGVQRSWYLEMPSLYEAWLINLGEKREKKNRPRWTGSHGTGLILKRKRNLPMALCHLERAPSFEMKIGKSFSKHQISTPPLC